MDFDHLLRLVGDEPLVESSFLVSGESDPKGVHRQLSRWTRAGKLYQLRRGIYALAPPHQRARPHPFVVANRLVRPSYISLQSALSFHGLIPESVPVTTSVTTARPGRFRTPLGEFSFRHLRVAHLWGYRLVTIDSRSQALVAEPEKALLDLLYLTPRSDRAEALEGLRLQNLARLDQDRLASIARRFRQARLDRAVEVVRALADSEAHEYEELGA